MRKEASTWSKVEKDRYSQGDSCRWSLTVAFSFSRQLQTVLCVSGDVQDTWVRARSMGQGSGKTVCAWRLALLLSN